MTVKLRLQRYGTKKRPFYRIVAATSTLKRDGKFLEILGLYHPLSPKDKQIRLEKDKILAWLGNGAQPSDTVRNILSDAKIWQDVAIRRSLKQGALNKKANEKAKAKRAK